MSESKRFVVSPHMASLAPDLGSDDYVSTGTRVLEVRLGEGTDSTGRRDVELVFHGPRGSRRVYVLESLYASSYARHLSSLVGEVESRTSPSRNSDLEDRVARLEARVTELEQENVKIKRELGVIKTMVIPVLNRRFDHLQDRVERFRRVIAHASGEARWVQDGSVVPLRESLAEVQRLQEVSGQKVENHVWSVDWDCEHRDGWPVSPLPDRDFVRLLHLAENELQRQVESA